MTTDSQHANPLTTDGTLVPDRSDLAIELDDLSSSSGPDDYRGSCQTGNRRYVGRFGAYCVEAYRIEGGGGAWSNWRAFLTEETASHWLHEYTFPQFIARWRAEMAVDLAHAGDTTDAARALHDATIGYQDASNGCLERTRRSRSAHLTSGDGPIPAVPCSLAEIALDLACYGHPELSIQVLGGTDISYLARATRTGMYPISVVGQLEAEVRALEDACR